jgi:protein ImuB
VPQQSGALVSGESRPHSHALAGAGPRREALWIAVSLAPPLRAAVTDTASENGLESLAVRCHRLTSKLSLEPPDGLLLEARGSLKLFGGLAAIKRELAGELRSRDGVFNVASAPTPLGALWLARHGSADAADHDDLRRRISALPLDVTAWPDDVIALLTEMGVSRIGDCLRLPRNGFARRVGRRYRADLDKVLGNAPDPRAEFALPERLSWKTDLPAESAHHTVLQQAVERMLDSLVEDLRRLQLQTGELEVVFHHRRRPATVKRLCLVRPAIEKHRFLKPLSVRLEYMSLSAPVVGVSLTAFSLEALEAEAPSLFGAGGGAPAADRGSRAALIECLRGRLSPEQVHGLILKAEHRPERVWGKKMNLSSKPAARQETSPWAHHRPLWILPAPLPLAGGIARLSELTGPERIESGWWDGEDIARDYYAAAAETGERLWIYRDRSSRDWYLHGIFG